MRAAQRHARHPAPVPRAPVSAGPGVGAVAVPRFVVPCALVPANNRLSHTHPTAHHHPQPPRPSPPPHTCASVLSCRMLPARHAPVPPAGHARRPETRQAPHARAARTCFRWPRCRCRGRGTCRCPMRPRTCPPMQSTPPQPPQPRPSQTPHPISPGPAHAATLPTTAASSSLPHPGSIRRVPPQPPAHPPVCRTDLAPLV
jgi:hypothetical protein